MTAEGRLTKDKFGFALPVDSPLYPKPPVFYRDMDNVSVGYETDEDAALDLLPQVEGLELVRPATARIILARMPFTTFGAYDEMYQLLDVTWQGTPAIFPVRILLNQDSAMAAGRELWGNPKKFGHIEWTSESEIHQGTAERPKGSRICTVLMRPEQPVELEPYEMNIIGLRVIPSPEKDAPPSLAQLILNKCEVRPQMAWGGQGSVHFGADSLLDPWHTLPVKRVKESLFSRADMDVVPRAEIIHEF